MSFNPSCITRLLPEPMSGLPAETSGVLQLQPKKPPLGSSPELPLVDAPYGLARLGLLNRLKISTRNWAPSRSLHLKSLNTEKSTFLKPASRKMFRPMVPKVPFTGGVITELRFTQQPPTASVLGSGATFAHCAPSDEGNGVTR